MRRKRTAQEDDGRVIAKMDVEGMPGRRGNKKTREEDRQRLRGKQAGRAVFGALLAALSVIGLFLLGGALFILFCRYVWF